MKEISAQRVKELRELTGATMVDCKNALIDFGGDFEAAKNKLKGESGDSPDQEPVE